MSERDDFFDGWALWQEHRPQSPEDWVRVAERCIDSRMDTSQGSVMFQAVVLAVKEGRAVSVRPEGEQT